MSIDPHPPEDARDGVDGGNTIAPLEGEPGIPSVTQRGGTPVSRKGLVAVGLLALTLLAVSAVSVNRAFVSSRTDADTAAARSLNRPSAAAAEPHRLDMTLPERTRAPIVSAPSEPVIPAIVPMPEELPADPIGVHRGAPPSTAPEDAPVVLVSSRPGTPTAATNDAGHRTQGPQESGAPPSADDSLEGTRRNLVAYQRQLQTLMASLTTSTASTQGTPEAPLQLAPVAPVAPTISAPPVAGGRADAATPKGLFGGQLQGSVTPRVSAGTLASPGKRSLTLAKGTAFTCALKTRIISAASGFVSCQVQRNVFSDNGRVLLIERGSHMDGEYRAASIRPGTVRIPVLWTRIRSPHGVTVDIDSPGTGQLGESGIDGYVDNRWGERIGAAMLLSLIDDSVKLIVQNQASQSQSDGQGNTIVLPSTVANTSKLAEKVLDSTINIAPLIYRNQGGIVGIVVARDVDFSSVYALKPVAQGVPR